MVRPWHRGEVRSFLLACLGPLAACAADAFEPPTGPVVSYELSRELIPLTNTEARDFGLDLDGDKARDNQLGMVFGTLASTNAPPVGDIGQQIASGELTMHVELQYPDPAQDSDAVALALSTPRGSDTPLLAPSSELPMRFGPGDAMVSLSFFGVAKLELKGARVVITRADDGVIAGTIGGGISRAELENQLAPLFAAAVNHMVAEQCTDATAEPCGCILTGAYGDGRYWIVLFDAVPHDCTITDDEILDSSLVVSLTAPDLTLDGEPLLSLGFGFEAVAAR